MASVRQKKGTRAASSTPPEVSSLPRPNVAAAPAGLAAARERARSPASAAQQQGPPKAPARTAAVQSARNRGKRSPSATTSSSSSPTHLIGAAPGTRCVVNVAARVDFLQAGVLSRSLSPSLSQAAVSTCHNVFFLTCCVLMSTYGLYCYFATRGKSTNTFFREPKSVSLPLEIRSLEGTRSLINVDQRRDQELSFLEGLPTCPSIIRLCCRSVIVRPVALHMEQQCYF